MKTARERVNEWLSHNSLGMTQQGYRSLVELLKEQDKISRHACAEACLEHGDAPGIEMIDRCHAACMNVKAV